MNKFAKKEWDHLTKLVCLAQEENKGNTEATEQAIAEITKEHGLTPDKLKEIKDFLESEREKETTRRKKEAENKALAERMATIVRTFALDTRDDLQSVREQKMKDFAKKHGITLAALKADVKASDRELASEGDHEDESSHQAKASKLKGQPVLSGTKEESREVAPGTDHWPRLAEDDKPSHICTDQFNGYLVAQHVGRDLRV